MTRQEFLRTTLGFGLLSAGMWSPASAQPYNLPPGPPDTEAQRLTDLVIANHFLNKRGLIKDGLGHITVRSLSNPKHYYMSRSMDPGLVRRRDMIELDENSAPVDPKVSGAYSERFIHGEIYRARPDVQSIVHSHSPAVAPFSVTDQPLKAMAHVAYFLGCTATPVFDLEDVVGEKNLMLVDTPRTGAALAKSLSDRQVVLMRGHGMAVVGPTIQDAVFRAIYTEVNAQEEEAALRLGKPKFMNCSEVTRAEAPSRQWAIWAAQDNGPLD